MTKFSKTCILAIMMIVPVLPSSANVTGGDPRPAVIRTQGVTGGDPRPQSVWTTILSFFGI